MIAKQQKDRIITDHVLRRLSIHGVLERVVSSVFGDGL